MSDASKDKSPDLLPTAVVVGAGGLGTAVAQRFARSHHVLLVDIDGARAAAIAESLRADGASVQALQCDVTSPSSVTALAQAVQDRGAFQTLVHVAGLSPAAADFDRIVWVNLAGPAIVMDALLPHVRPGTVAIAIASLGAHIGRVPDDVADLLRSMPSSPELPDRLRDIFGKDRINANLAYQVSKVGLLMLCRRRAGEWGRHGGRIVSLSPGMIATPMGAREFASNAAKRALFEKSPLGREGSMEEIVDVAEFLASAKASFITGTDILVDGGVSGAMSDVPFNGPLLSGHAAPGGLRA